MTILETVKSDLLKARKARDSNVVTMLSTLLGEFERKAKSVTDAEAVSVIKKNVEDNPNEAEITLLSSYLPQTLSDQELAAIITQQIQQGSNLGQVMKHLKETYAGRYDGKLASDIAKKVSQ